MARFSLFTSRSERERRPVRPSLETLEDRLVPSTMAGEYNDGIWRYDTNTGWSRITTALASTIDVPNPVDVDDAGDVYVAYSNGLWRWSAATASWSHPSNLPLDGFQVTASGIFYGDFGTQGVWRWDPSTNGWAHLSNLNPYRIAVSDSDAFFGIFSSGTWRWTPTAGWSLLTANQPDAVLHSFATDTAGDFVGIFSSGVPASQAGTWRWSPTTGWAHLSTSAPNSMAVSANGAIFEDRGTNGIWSAAPGATSFNKIDSTSYFGPASLTALPDGSLYVKRLVSGDPHYTGWYWNASAPGLGLVKFLPIVDAVFAEAIGKDGDIFFDDDTTPATGTGYFSLQSAYHLLGGLNTQQPFYLASQR
jgi:hypothetical protein